MECIETIIQDIEVNSFFDSHYVIARMIRDFSDNYLRIAQKIDPETKHLTLRVHQQIGNMINKLNGRLVERQNSQSLSMNIHGNESSCALWKRIK